MNIEKLIDEEQKKLKDLWIVKYNIIGEYKKAKIQYLRRNNEIEECERQRDIYEDQIGYLRFLVGSGIINKIRVYDAKILKMNANIHEGNDYGEYYDHLRFSKKRTIIKYKNLSTKIKHLKLLLIIRNDLTRKTCFDVANVVISFL